MKQAVVATIAALGGSLVGGVVVASNQTSSRATISDYFGVRGQAGASDGTLALPNEVVVTDWDEDGFPDLMFRLTIQEPGGAMPPSWVFMKNQGGGQFVEELRVLESGSPFENLEGFRAVDIDADGIDELVAFRSIQEAAGDPVSTGVFVIPNTLAPWQPSPARAADLNGDQMVDGGDLGIMLGLWGPVEPE